MDAGPSPKGWAEAALTTSPRGSVALDEVPQGTVIAVTGALDLSLAPQLRRTVERALRLRPALLVIGLSGVTFLASAGMSELVLAKPAAQRRGGRGDGGNER